MSLLQDWASAPSQGAYPEHEFAPILRQAVEQMVFQQFANQVDIKSGQSVTIPTVGRLAEPTSTLLNESTSIPIDKLSITAKTIEMQERGRAVHISRKAMNRSPIDLLAEHRDRISEQMALTMDKVLSENGFQSGQLKYAPTGSATYNLGTSGSFGAAALSNINFWHLQKLRDLAYRTYFMPKMPNGKFSLVLSTAGIREIQNDPQYIQINSPQNSGVFSQNKIQMSLFDIDIYEDNHTLSDTVGTNSDVAEGVFIAKDAVWYAILQNPSVHYDASEDLGRFVKLGWYGDWNAGPTSDTATAGLARLIHIGST